jgi:hypothetical protein
VLRVFDSRGRLVLSQAFNGTDGGALRLHAPGLARGVYVLQAESAGSTVRRRFAY